jgi:hypothetical protein
VKVILEGQENLNRQQQEFQAAVNHREMTINGLREEINTREALSKRLSDQQTNKFLLWKENAEKLQWRLDVLAGAAPSLVPGQVMAMNQPQGSEQPVRLRTGEGTTGPPGPPQPPPEGGGNGAPSGSGNDNGPSGSGFGGNPGGNGPPGPPGSTPPPEAGAPVPCTPVPPHPEGNPDDPDPPGGGSPNPGPRRERHEDDDDNHRKRVTGTIDLGKLPNHGGFHLWRSGVRDEVSAVYADTKTAF